mgnify:CR=1 FL=1
MSVEDQVKKLNNVKSVHSPIRTKPPWGCMAVYPPPIKLNYSRDTKLKSKEGELRILYFNTRGLASEERLHELELALEELKWDMVGLSEVGREGEELVRRTNGNYFCGRNERAKRSGILYKW